MQRCVLRCLVHLLAVILTLWAASSLYVATRLLWEHAHAAHRALGETVMMIPVMSAIFAAIVPIVVFPSFGVTQALLGAALFLFGRKVTIGNTLGLLACVLVLSLLSFESFDYLVPSYRFFTDEDPYWAHGLTERRWAIFLGLQSCLAAFSFWRLHRGKLLYRQSESNTG